MVKCSGKLPAAWHQHDAQIAVKSLENIDQGSWPGQGNFALACPALQALLFKFLLALSLLGPSPRLARRLLAIIGSPSAPDDMAGLVECFILVNSQCPEVQLQQL